MDYWAAAQEYAELKSMYSAAQAPVASGGPLSPSGQPAASNAAVVRQLRGGASWFYWIAGLSLVNAIVAFTGSNGRFLVGLAVPWIISLFSRNLGSAGALIVLALNVVAAGVFVLFGVFASKGQLWAFIVGMVLFGLDGLVLAYVSDWLSVAFHAFVLFCLYRGFSACRQLN